MFTCIEFVPGNQGFINRICEKIKPPEPEREYVQVKGATPFLRLKVKRDNADWQKISAILNGEERLVLVEEEFSLPENTTLERFTSSGLGTVMIFSEFANLLKKVNLPTKISFSVFDREGFLLPYIVKTVPFVRNISVYTENISGYFQLSARIMEETGMCIKINEYESCLTPAQFVVADRYGKNMKNSDLVFLGEKNVLSYNTVTGEGISLPEEYRILKSAVIDDLLFASALFEKNSASGFDNSRFNALFLSRKTVTEDELAEKIRSSVNA